MTGLIDELQRQALDHTVQTTTLLHMVKIIATKLQLDDVQYWVNLELSGYDNQEVPKYRIVRGKPMAFNPYNGWIPFGGDVKVIEAISTRGIGQPLASLEERAKGGLEGTITIGYSPWEIKQLNQGNEVFFGRMALHCSAGCVADIIDAVRNLVLDWALNMEKAGITGEGMSFTTEEKRAAHSQSTTIHIGSIGAVAGNIGVGNTARDISMSSINFDDVRNIVKQARDNIGALQGVDRVAVESRLTELETELRQSVPSASRVRSGLAALHGVLIGATGNVVAAGIIALIQNFS